MPNIGTFFPRLGKAAPRQFTAQSDYYGGWDQTTGSYGGANARWLGNEAGTSQVEAKGIFATIPNDSTLYDLGIAQFISDPLRTQTITAGTWIIPFAVKLTNASATYQWRSVASLVVVNGQTGERRAAIFDIDRSGAHTQADERTAYHSIVVADDISVFEGDYLSLELGIAVINSGGASAVPAAFLYADGTTGISADNVVIASAKSQTLAPRLVDVSATVPGQAEPFTVTDEDARSILVSLLPPGNLYETEDPGDDLYKLFAALGKTYRVLGFDYVEKLKREINPATAIEDLPDWEAALGISTFLSAGGNNATRQAAIVAKTREQGATTLENVRGIIGSLLGYASESDLVVYECNRAALKTKHTYTGLPNSSGTIPVSASVLTRHFMVSDGDVSAAGVQLTLNITHTVSANLSVTLTNPFGASTTWTNISTGSITTSDIVLYDKASNSSTVGAFIGKPMAGQWTMTITSSATTGTLVSASLFAEGGGKDGRGGSIFTWGPYADPDLVGDGGASPDYRGARFSLKRIKPAYSRAYLITENDGLPGDLIPGRCIPKS